MTGIKLNKEQEKLVESHEGIYLVDAGAGTGKTATVTRRYAKILEDKDVEPGDLLLLTFTNSAAEEMRERVINHCSYGLKELRDAPISTFHRFSKQLLSEKGFEAPGYIGINDTITSSIDVVENKVLERQRFKNFLKHFREKNKEYSNILRALKDENILKILKELASRGIIPEMNGWYRNTGEHLDGDFEEYMEKIRKMNTPVGNSSSELRSRTSNIFKKCLPENAPSNIELRGQPYVDKKINEDYAVEAFKEDRDELKHFIHDVYYRYMEYCLSRNYLNFSFLLVFAYVLLMENKKVREDKSFSYTFIDEFQDTNEIQLKIAMLLSKGNIAAVGDWKQSIYSFQHADVNNIKNFKSRIKRYKRQLNFGEKRITYDVENVVEIPLRINYRSTEKILEFSRDSLVLPGKKDEKIDREETIRESVSLLPDRKQEEKRDFVTRIEAFKSQEEIEAVLEKIQEIENNPEYEIDDGLPGYKDIAVFTRNRKFGIELYHRAQEYGIPVGYEGGVELFRTRPAILLLAWLRIMDYRDSKKGWSVVLEEAGYDFGEMKSILGRKKYPEDMEEFREKLKDIGDISAVTRKVLDRYGIDNAFSDKLLEVLQNVFESSLKNFGDMIDFVVESIESKARYEVDNSRECSVTVQTIHSAKGLQYPIVLIANINTDRFPSSRTDRKRIIYDDTVGLRMKKFYDPDNRYCFDNWKAHLVSKVISKDYDEERRLMYVAMTRAENHLLFSAEEGKQSTFFENLELEKQFKDPEPEEIEEEVIKKNKLEVDVPEIKVPVKRSVHSVMDLDETAVGRGSEFGTMVHRFAERYAKGEDVEPSNKDEIQVKEFIDSLEGDLRPEVPILVPVEEDGRKVVYSGVIDLLHVKESELEIIDWKTDVSRTNHEEYRKQLEIYELGVSGKFVDKKVSSRIFYTNRAGG